ncbi:phage head spike fiber domain-containing protein [Psychrobacter sp. 1Y1]|uniref:phage head spike fiber domain-containing protein n=1 Tax=Psychrobacter sp. 1Y1 TaxID=3453574 RepID=UPI003F457625
MQYFGFDRPSFLSGFFGFFESGPKLQADFTTGEYKASGEAKTFAEVFDFNRAGKAWLIKDTGLVEYAVDVPRFDNGLLIEQSATNVWKQSLLQNGVDNFWYKGGNYSLQPNILGTGQELVMPNDVIIYTRFTAANGTGLNGAGCFSCLVRSSDNTPVTFGSFGSKLIYSGVHTQATIQPISTVLGLSKTQGVYERDTNGGVSSKFSDIIVNGMQFELGATPTSFIVTNTTSVTRPADFIASKITTGTALTGDWDSTLNLSLVNGQLSWTGYGRIRSLEIN